MQITLQGKFVWCLFVISVNCVWDFQQYLMLYIDYGRCLLKGFALLLLLCSSRVWNMVCNFGDLHTSGNRKHQLWHVVTCLKYLYLFINLIPVIFYHNYDTRRVLNLCLLLSYFSKKFYIKKKNHHIVMRKTL